MIYIESKCAAPKCKQVLDRFSHHALTCNHFGFVSTRHNNLTWAFHQLCRQARVTSHKEKGSNATDRTRPADVLIQNNCSSTSFQALDFTVVSPLILNRISGASSTENPATYAPRRWTKQQSTNMQQTTPNVENWAGIVYQWQLISMECGVKKLSESSELLELSSVDL